MDEDLDGDLELERELPSGVGDLDNGSFAYVTEPFFAIVAESVKMSLLLPVYGYVKIVGVLFVQVSNPFRVFASCASGAMMAT